LSAISEGRVWHSELAGRGQLTAPSFARGRVGWRGISASAIQTLTPDTRHLYNPNRLWEKVKSDALLRERRVTRARIAAKREVAGDGGIDLAGDQTARKQRQGAGRRCDDRQTGRVRHRRCRLRSEETTSELQSPDRLVC